LFEEGVMKPKPNSDLAYADLVRDLAIAKDRRKKRFAAIVRFFRRYEARGPAGEMMAQIRRDQKLCKLLCIYEADSEIIGIMEFVHDLKIKRHGARPRQAAS
jgi:hypothetical protein